MKKQRKGEEGRSAKEGREGPPLSADKRQKWMNSIGRRTSSSLLSARLHELRTHFIEICEIRKAGYRVIYHRATLAHTSSQLHNKSHNWHSFFGLLTIICCSLYKVALGLLFSRSNKLGWVSVWETLITSFLLKCLIIISSDQVLSVKLNYIWRME